MRKSKCYIYTRVSTSMQVDGFSLEAQKDKLRKYAEYQEMTIAGEYSDEGKSGKNIEGRTDFMRMLADISSCKDSIDYVLVFKLSRFGRNAADVLSSLQEMQDFGVNLICVEDGIDSSKDSGKLMISVLSAVAEIERENILVQTMEGRNQKAREGKWNGGFAPYGYKLENGKLVIAEDEAEVIREIFHRYTFGGLGLGRVAISLNQQGFKKKKRQNNTIDAFTYSFVKNVIDNPIYCGKLAWGRRKTEKITGKRNQFHVVKQKDYEVFEGEHEAIISVEDFELAQDKRKTQAKKIEKKNPHHYHVLSGLLKCPCCGKGMYGNVGRRKKKDGTFYKEHWYYYCKHKKVFDGHDCTYTKNWTQSVIDNAVAEFVLKLVRSPEFEATIKEKMDATVNADDLKIALADIKKMLRQTIGTKDRLIEQIDAIDVSDKHYNRKLSDLEKRLNKMYDQIAEYEGQIQDLEVRIHHILKEQISGENVYQCLLQFDKLYDKFTDAEKKEFFNSIIEEIHIHEEAQEGGQILKKIIFKFPISYDKDLFKADSSGEDCLESEKQVETVVLMSRVKN